MKEEPFAHDIPSRFDAEPGPSAEVEARILSEISEIRVPRIPVQRRLAMAVLSIPFAALAVLGARSAIFGTQVIRYELHRIALGPLVAELALLGAVTFIATGIATHPGKRGLGSMGWLLGLTAALVAPTYFLVEIATSFRVPNVDAVRGLHPWGMPCLLLATVVGTFVLTALTWSLRYAVPVSPRLRGAALGAASGAWAGFALVVHCPSTALVHLLVSHVAPVAVFTVLGAMLTPRLLRP